MLKRASASSSEMETGTEDHLTMGRGLSLGFLADFALSSFDFDLRSGFCLGGLGTGSGGGLRIVPALLE